MPAPASQTAPDQTAADTSSKITELRVSGHMMALEPGVYCVFPKPGSAPAATDTGLPTVRVSPAPGLSRGQVEISGLDPDGLVQANAATLIRVSGKRSQVMVTVYQSQDTTAEAPQLQVIQIAGAAIEASSPAPASAPIGKAPAGSTPTGKSPEIVEVVAHIYGRGDVGAHLGDWTGDPGSKRWIEGFAVLPTSVIPGADIEYQAVLGRGWLSPWSEGGQFCGSRGMSLPILGLRARLRGASAETHQISVSATFVDGTEVGPVDGSEACEAPSLAALEAFRVAIEPTGKSAKPARAGRKPAAKPAPEPEPVPAKAKPASKSAAKPASKPKPPAPRPAPPRAPSRRR